MTNRPFRTYNGGKNGSGVYQSIINQIPPHIVFISGFAGNCGVLANKRFASMANIAVDLDTAVVDGWSKIPGVLSFQGDFCDIIIRLINLYPADIRTQIFVFLDPPYLSDVRSCKKGFYKYKMEDPESHLHLLRLAKSLAGNYGIKIMFTHYPCDLYNEELKDWHFLDIQGRTRYGMRIERLYMNYQPPQSLHDYRFLGENFRERELYKKMRCNMVHKFRRLKPIEKNMLLQALHDDQEDIWFLGAH